MNIVPFDLVIGWEDELDPRYLKVSNNLADLDDAAIARTNLGLIAGGTGDIWVEKAGDTITGNLTMPAESFVGPSSTTGIYFENGNVGIGTTNPVGTLDVVGAIYGNNLNNYLDLYSGGNAAVGSRGNINFIIDSDNNQTNRKFTLSHDNGVALLTVLETGNVGIGTTGPNTQLHVYNNSSSTNPRLRIEQGGTGDAALNFLLTGTRNWTVGVDNSDSDKFKISPYLAFDSGTALTIQTNGNVGIGTTGPDGTLHVHTASAGSVSAASVADNLIVENDISGGISILVSDGNVSNLYFGDASDNDVGRIVYHHGTNQMKFTTNASQQMVIDNAGNVGIGTTSPSAKLHIDQSSTTGAKPVLTLDQADISEEFIKLIGSCTDGALTGSIVEAADVGTATVAAYLRVYVQDDLNVLTDDYYYLPVYSLS